MDNGGAFTDSLLARAGEMTGATALDIGCGGGDVTFRLAAAVGEGGSVLGVDLNPAALDAARRRATARDIRNATFEQRDFRDLVDADGTFDIVACRRVLMYLPDQVAAVGAMRRILRPSGCLIVQEHDASIVHSSADLPLHREARSWIWGTVAAEGANTGTGFDLHRLLSSAGFSRIDINAEGIVETPSQAGLTATIVRAMMGRIEAAGVTTAERVDIDTLDERLLEERRSSGATFMSETIFGAIARP